jgi:transposase
MVRLAMLVPRQPPAADILALRACSRRLIALTEQRSKAWNQLHALEEASFLKENMDLLLTVRGIGETSAIQLMGELLVLPDDMTNRHRVAMAGLDPRHFSSGTSVDKLTRIGKIGNRFLRMALYMPALSAANHSPHVRAYYQHPINDNGLKKPQALCAVMRKLLGPPGH